MTSLADPANIAPLALYGSVLACAVLAVLRRDTAVMWGLALVVVPFLPASNVLFPVGAVVAERVRPMPTAVGGRCAMYGALTPFLPNKYGKNSRNIEKGYSLDTINRTA